MIEISDLGFSFGRKAVLKHITMRLEEGRIYGLLGENGVGKTTLLTLLCGLKCPTEGSVRVDGQEPWRRRPSLLQDICFLPDDVPAPSMKAAHWAEGRGRFYPNYDPDAFATIMREFETDPEAKMNRMSAGQLKKTHIAFSLAARTKYLLLDEPSNGLDIPAKAQLRSAMMKHTREDSVIVISTHQVRDLENIIDPIIILDRQEVLLNASAEEITRRLYFDYGNGLHPDNFYSEQLPGGFIQVRPNTDGQESKLDIEALFNAVLRNKESIHNLFHQPLQ